MGGKRKNFGLVAWHRSNTMNTPVELRWRSSNEKHDPGLLALAFIKIFCYIYTLLTSHDRHVSWSALRAGVRVG